MALNKAALMLLTTALLVAPSERALAMEGVVTSIKPVHSLVAAVMKGVGEPSLLIEGAGSPHNYTLRPSQAAMLEGAQLVFWVGEGLETFLTGPLQTLAGNARVVEFSQSEGVELLAFREGGPFEAHVHHHDDDHDHGHDHSHDHDGQDHAHDEDDLHGHDHGEYDMHIWLDPMNARAMVDEIETVLAELDPDNAGQYQSNAETVRERLGALMNEVEDALAAVENRPFIVFHDAYQYYEERFSFPAAGSITVNPEVMPGAQRVSDIQDRVRELEAACVFSERQFEPRLISVVTEGTDAQSGVLDPLGSEVEDGPDLYFELIGNLTNSLVECLADGQ